MSFYTRLNNLEKANNNLKSRLLHEQLKCGNYSFKNLEKELSLVLDAYNVHKSIVLAASSVGIDGEIALKWFFEGLRGNILFKNFYLAVSGKGRDAKQVEDIEAPEYEIRSVGDAWIYTAFVDGEKVSVISSDLDSLNERVKRKNLPLIV